MKKKQLISIILAVATLLALSVPVFAAGKTDTTDAVEVPPLRVMVNGDYVKFPDAKPEINKDNRTMVPFRAAVEALGYRVGWHQGYVSAVNGDERIDFKIGSSKYTLTTPDDVQTKTMDTVPYIKDSRTYVPLRFLAEAFGQIVEWKADVRTVVITDDK